MITEEEINKVITKEEVHKLAEIWLIHDAHERHKTSRVDNQIEIEKYRAMACWYLIKNKLSTADSMKRHPEDWVLKESK
jgi:hypothetical protein